MVKNKYIVNVELRVIDAAAKTKRKHEVTENTTKDEEEEVKVDLDTILISEVGQFGRFQLQTLALAGLASLYMAFSGEYVFTTARINTRCLVPQCEDASNAVFAAAWFATALPSRGGSFDNCQQFGNTTDTVFSNNTCSSHLFDTCVTLPCGRYVYENTHTVVYDFDLACNEWHRSLIGFSRTVGTFFSIPLTGFASDRWGRRIALALNGFNSAWLGLIRYWANSYASFVALEMIESVFSSATFSASFILALEIVGPKYRSIAGAILSSCFSLGQVLLGIIAWAVPDWRLFTLAIYIPQFLIFSYFWVLTESVRWYLSKGRYEETEALLKEVARINRKQLSEKSLQMLRVTAEEDKKKQAIEEAEKAQEPWLPVQVFRHKQILVRCMVMPVCWITTMLVYYGLSIMSVNISGNKYSDYVAVAAAAIPGYWLSAFLLSRVGRKTVLMGGYWVCAATQAAYIFMPSGNYGLSLAVYLVGKCSIATVMTAIYVYTAELFQVTATKYRHSLLAFSSMMGRIGSIAAPLIPAMGAATFEEMPFVLFGSCALLSGLLILLMPETLGTKLPDTMHEADNIGRTQQLA